MSIIRLPGIIFLGVLSAILYLFGPGLAAPIVHQLIEHEGSKSLGADLDIGSVTIRWSPLGLSLYDVQATNPYRPMQNILDAKRIDVAIDPKPLLMREIVVDEIIIDGTHMLTARARSGANAFTKKSSSAFQLPKLNQDLPAFSVEVPDDINAVIDSANLTSIASADSLREKIKSSQESLKNQLKNLPSKNQLDQYKAEFKSLKSGKNPFALLKQAGEIKSLQKKFKKDLASIKDFRKLVAANRNELKSSIGNIDQLIDKDVQAIQATLGFDPAAVNNLSQILLGERASAWLQSGFNWYEQFAPLSDSLFEQSKTAPSEEASSKPSETPPVFARGRYVSFTDVQQNPRLYIKNLRFTGDSRPAQITGFVKHIATEPHLIAHPLKADLTGNGIPYISSMILKATADHRNPLKPNDIVSLALKGLTLTDVILSDGKLPLSLEQAFADIKLSGKLLGEQIDIDLLMQFLKTSLNASAENLEDPIIKALATALEDISQFDIQALVDGSLNAPSVKIKASLDQLFKRVLQSMLQGQLGDYEDKLRGALVEKIAPVKTDLLKDLAGFQEIDALAGKSLKDWQAGLLR